MPLEKRYQTFQRSPARTLCSCVSPTVSRDRIGVGVPDMSMLTLAEPK